MVILFIGPSGSGKDTQAQLLAVKSSFQNISTGDLFRDLSNGNSNINMFIRKMLKDGFANDWLTFGILQIYMKYVHGNDFILNGAVRSFKQVELLDQILKEIDQELIKVFNFVAPNEVLIQRLTNRLFCTVCKANFNTKTQPPRVDGICDRCGSILTRREDDNEESIQKRLNAFYFESTEIIKEYKKRNILLDIDATASIQDIHKQIIEEVSKFLM